jgi:hypothetical protein
MPPWKQDFVLRAPIRGSSKVPLWHAIARKIKEEGDGKNKGSLPYLGKRGGPLEERQEAEEPSEKALFSGCPDLLPAKPFNPAAHPQPGRFL